jgi:asparaginyl-tRNA synthetase
MNLQENLIVYLIERILKRCEQELGILERNTDVLEAVKSPFIRLTYHEAVFQLRALGSSIEIGRDFGNDDETILTKQYDRPLFVEKYPAEIKAFYMKHDPENPSLVLCNDLLAPEGYGEIIGGSQREDDEQLLRRRIQDEKLPEKEFEWYLDLRKYGSVPHSGFGLGLERLVSWVCGLEHVREAIPFPRTIYRVFP